MFSNSQTANRFASAIFAVAISAVFMASAIIPASPNGFIA